MRITELRPPRGQIAANGRAIEREIQRRAGAIQDRKTAQVRERQQRAMKSAQLGKLSNAVKAKTGRSVDRYGNDNAYGVIYAADGDDSRAGQALQAYSRGTFIKPVKGPWLWFQTEALARTSKIGGGRRARLTPERYNRMGKPLGELRFAKLSNDFAKLYVDVANVSVKNGRATPVGPRRSRVKVRTEKVTIFFGIRNTRRGQRYDPKRIVAQGANEIPVEIAEDMTRFFRQFGR